MAVKTTAELLVQVASIAGNGSNSLTGDQIGAILKDIIESYVNTSTNSTDLATNSYRSGGFVRPGPATTTVTFSSSIGTTSYNVFFEDIDGIISTNAFNKTVNGFDVTISVSGQAKYFAVIDN